MITRNGHSRSRARSRSARRPSVRLRREATQVGNNFQQMGNIARQAAQQQLNAWRDNAAEYVERGKGKMQQAERTIEGYICEQPVKSVLIAAGLGLFVGRFLIGRSRD